MGQACSVCNHSNRRDIDRALAQGISMASLAREYRVSEYSLMNHRDNHLSRQMVTAVKNKEAMESLDILGNMNDLIRRTKDILDKAEAKGKNYLALNAIREARASYELLAKIAAYLHEENKLNEEEQRTQIEQEIKQQARAVFKDSLNVLTENEKHLLTLLNTKIITQDKGFKIAPDNPTQRQIERFIETHLVHPDFSDALKANTPKTPKSTHSDFKTPIRRTRYPGGETLGPDTLSPSRKAEDDPRDDNPSTPVNVTHPDEIPSMRWSDHPLNPRKHLRDARRGYKQ